MGYHSDPRLFIIILLLVTVVAQLLPLLTGLVAKLEINAVLENRAGDATALAVILAAVVVFGFILSRLRTRPAIVLIEKASERYDRFIMGHAAGITDIE